MSLRTRAGRPAIFTGLTTVVLDRVTKLIATETLADQPGRSFLADTVRIAYVENTGGFLGLGSGLPPEVRTWIFTVATGLVLALLIGAAIRYRWTGSRMLGLSLFAAGGASNLVDRILQGSVVDFLNVGIGSLRTGVFNVADMAIMAGVAFFLASETRRGRQEDLHREDPGHSDPHRRDPDRRDQDHLDPDQKDPDQNASPNEK